ncbi:unnamed protein product [Linum tenue]|uniref:Uncharacterized protein n=1 Tax=Linum tenue TaxID=586396 RepID=A0AAV0PV66_9ROSI|nr:unnamed protein product [Linum tenue]
MSPASSLAGDSVTGGAGGGKAGGGRRKRRSGLWLFRRLKFNKESLRWRWKFLTSVFKWKRVNLQISLVDDVLFKIVSVLEAIVLVATLSFFYLCCGCHF